VPERPLGAVTGKLHAFHGHERPQCRLQLQDGVSLPGDPGIREASTPSGGAIAQGKAGRGVMSAPSRQRMGRDRRMTSVSTLSIPQEDFSLDEPQKGISPRMCRKSLSIRASV
jgi:hypothetical protein